MTYQRTEAQMMSSLATFPLFFEVAESFENYEDVLPDWAN